jgi:hypothetical protein
MKKILVAACCLFLGSVNGLAQGTEHRAQGYGFFAPGVSSSGSGGFGHVGVGGEALIKRVGVGGEIGYLASWRSISGGLGVGSVNGSFNLKPGKISPFVTGGGTLFFRRGTANGYNFGGGVHYWLSDRAGLRFEVRDNVIPEYYGDQHLVGFRIGVVLR